MNLDLRSDVMRAEDENTLFLGKNLVFDGTNFVDTGFAPFSSENANVDFMISIRLSSFTNDVAQAVILGCKYEGTLNGQSYPGIYIRRRNSDNNLEFGGYNYAYLSTNNLLNQNLYIWRKSGSWKYKIGDGSTGNLSVRVATFNQNIVLGAGVQTNGTKFRYSKCKIDYIRIELI